MRELGVRMIPAYSPQARGRSERNFGLGRAAAARVALAGNHDSGGGERSLQEEYIAAFNGRTRKLAAVLDPRLVTFTCMRLI